MTALKTKILEAIAAKGPMSVADYMRIALMDGDHGYYVRKDPFGRSGDFITAPEISQMFGEIIGLFFVQTWSDCGSPKRFHLVELGSGRGTLMADMLRAARLSLPFLTGAEITLIEASPALRAIQAQALAHDRVRWAESLDQVGEAPVFLIANEFLDALPARQWVRRDGDWRERCIGSEGETLAFTLSDALAPSGTIPTRFREAPEGSIFEIGGEAQDVVRKTASLISQQGGVALFIDYGHAKSDLGDTFQAVKAHRYADPLADPGDADLTFHVDFEAVATVARAEGVRVSGPTTQGAFLKGLGIETRAANLKRALPAEASAIDAALERLTSPEGMGSLFKVLAISQLHSPPLPGIPC